ncbi:MAG: thioredoxin family protein [Deltaproteobacteria bacterium]
MSTEHVLKSGLSIFSKNSLLLAGAAVAALFGAGRAQAAPIAWNRDLRRATREAVARRRPLLVVVGARWCGPCRKMHSETFPNPAVAARVNSRFIPVLLDADEQPEAVKKLGVDAFPTVLVVSPEQKILGRLTGFQSASQLDAQLASYQPAPVRAAPSRPAQFRPAPYRPANDQALSPAPAPFVSFPGQSTAVAAADTKPWAQRMWDAIRASHSPPRTTLEAAIAFSTGR